MTTTLDIASSQAKQSAETDWLARVRPSNWKNPKPQPLYDLVIIGAGPAGLAAAETARHHGLKVALIERAYFGGNSLNTGTIPSKTLIRSAGIFEAMRNADKFGASVFNQESADLKTIRERIRQVRARISEYHSVERVQASGVDVYFGAARFAGQKILTVEGIDLHFRKALIATGARPKPSTIPGLEEGSYWTASSIFDMTVLPRRMAVIGGGPLGCELAQAFRRLGSHVVIVQDDPQFLPHEERDAAELLSMALDRDGVEIRLNTSALGVRDEKGVKFIDTVNNEVKSSIPVDEILLGVGTVPNLEGLGLERAGITSDNVRGVHVDDYLRTTNPNVYAAGDICMEAQLTNVAEATGRLAVRNAFLGRRKRHKDLIVPWCTYCDPEIAHVGMHVWEARLRSISIKSYTVMMQDIDRAMTDGQDYGFVKIHVKEGSDKILGATIVASRASEMINEVSVAMTAGIGLRSLARALHAYPAQSEAIRLAALAYKRNVPLSWWEKLCASLTVGRSIG